MKRFFITALVAGALAFPAAAALKVGEKAPSFKAKASLAGKTQDFSLDAALKKGPVVVYFYPAAFTQGCSAQAHAFAENADKFAAVKTTIIGISGDKIEKLNAFSADPLYCAGKFPVASDPDGSIGKSFGIKVTVRDPNAPPSTYRDLRGNAVDTTVGLERLTFVITPDHKVVAVLPEAGTRFSMQDHAVKSLELVQAMSGKKPS